MSIINPFLTTHFRKEAELSGGGQHAGQVLIEEINQFAVITPHELLHCLVQEGPLLESLEGGTDQYTRKVG